MEFNMNNLRDYTDEELITFQDEIIDLWDKTNEVFSLTDLLEISRELTLREYNINQ